MNENRTVKITLAIASALVKRVDELAKQHYTTRSDILRMALIEFIKRPENAPPTSKALLEVLAAKPLQILRSYQKGQIAFKQLLEAGIDGEMQMELMKLGEL